MFKIKQPRKTNCSSLRGNHPFTKRPIRLSVVILRDACYTSKRGLNIINQCVLQHCAKFSIYRVTGNIFFAFTCFSVGWRVFTWCCYFIMSKITWAELFHCSRTVRILLEIGLLCMQKDALQCERRLVLVLTHWTALISISSVLWPLKTKRIKWQ